MRVFILWILSLVVRLLSLFGFRVGPNVVHCLIDNDIDEFESQPRPTLQSFDTEWLACAVQYLTPPTTDNSTTQFRVWRRLKSDYIEIIIPKQLPLKKYLRHGDLVWINHVTDLQAQVQRMLKQILDESIQAFEEHGVNALKLL